jgi:uncharacterized membrane protein
LAKVGIYIVRLGTSLVIAIEVPVLLVRFAALALLLASIIRSSK